MALNEEMSYKEALLILTEREREVLELVGRFYTTDEIAEELNISRRTVDKHKERICKKVKVRGRGALVKWYHNNKGEGGSI